MSNSKEYLDLGLYSILQKNNMFLEKWWDKEKDFEFFEQQIVGR